MISTLHIKNIGIIDDLSIDLNKGLNVLTGETGAGKTLIIDSLAIIAGGRFSKEMIRKGEKNSFVELCIYAPENEKSIDGNIIVSREINNTGKNMCKINGRMVTVNELKEFMGQFIEIHGQQDNQKLLDKQTHLEYVDGFIGEKLYQIKKKYKEIYYEYKNMEQELKANYGDDKERERKLDLLKYQLTEIEEADLKVEEEEELEEKRTKMMNAEKIYQNLNEASTILEGSNIDNLSSSIRALEKIETLDPKYEKAASDLKSMYYEMQEISRDISGYCEEIYFDEEERNYIEERLDLIHTLKRKYGNNIEEILKYKEEIAKEIEHIENLEQYNNKLKIEINKKQEQLDEIAEAMHNIRIKSGKELSEKINKILKELEMKNAEVSVKIEKLEEYKETGKDLIEFFIKTNLGEDEKALNKIASGGEMSRIMLAVKSVLAKTDNIDVMIFDEIDTGISGKAANSVAELLSEIGQKHQVLCISHLPNIAAVADHNYFINKQVENNRTTTNIKHLEENEVLCEIARISSGEVNEVTIKYATELRNKKVS